MSEASPESAEQFSCALHEVSNALTVVLGWLEMANQAGSLQEAKKAIAIAQEHARRGRIMARRSLGAEADSVLERRLACDVAVFAGTSVQPQASTHGVKINVVAEPGSDLRIEGDGDVLQVLTNLLLNAIDFSPRDSEVELRVSRSDSHVLFQVKDHGPGVALAICDELFEQGVTTRATGAGIGLPTSRRLAEGHGGSLTLANPGELGACFQLTWPAAPSARIAPIEPKGAGLSGCRVLMIEDDPAISTLVELSLEAHGAQILSIVDAEQVDEVLSSRPVFDVVLLDLSPIKGRVEEILARIRNLAPHAAVVLMSGEPSGIPHEAQGRIHSWIRKPFDMEQLVQTCSLIYQTQKLA